MNESAYKLLTKLAVLLREHPPEDFEELAGLLRRPKFSATLARLLDELAVVAKTERKPKHGAKARNSQRVTILQSLRLSVEDDQRAALEQLEQRLLSRSVFKSLPEVVRAVEASGFSLAKRRFRNREDLVREILKSASVMPVKDILAALDTVGARKTPNDLQGWSDIIVSK